MKVQSRAVVIIVFISCYRTDVIITYVFLSYTDIRPNVRSYDVRVTRLVMKQSAGLMMRMDC